MGKVKRPRPIRLTNRTAVGLRKSAQRIRSAWLIAMCAMTMLFTVLAVYLGFSWLPAVPLTLMAGGIIITLMMIISRSQYLLLISQAICTEAASRQMEENRSEQHRRQKAIEQLAAMRADVREAQKNGMMREGFRGEESLLFDLLTGRGEESDEEMFTLRRSQEDDEMYAASDIDDKNEQSDDEEDLYPPKKDKRAAQAAPVITVSSGNTRTLMKTVKAEVPVQMDIAAEEETGVRRRRRRSVPVNTASLQLIKNNQAQ